MATGDAARRFLDNAMAAQMPAMKQQQEGMRQYLQGRGQRVGAKGAAQQARKAVDVYATRAGDVASRLGAESEKMGQHQEQFETQQAAWEKQFAETQKQNKLNQALAQYQATGQMTPEMMELLGLDLSKSDVRGRDKQLDILGMQPGGGGTEQAPWAGGSFGQNNEMLYKRAMMPGSQFSTRSQRNQQAWLQSQFG